MAEAQRAARVRAERFGVEYVEPKLNVILSREEFRKYMSATGGRNPLMLETAPVAGIDTTCEEVRMPFSVFWKVHTLCRLFQPCTTC